MITQHIDPRIRMVVKASDETVNNSNVLQDDDDFTFSLPANSIWLAKGNLYFTSGATPDFQYQWIKPADCVISGYEVYMSLAGAVTTGVPPVAAANSCGGVASGGRAITIDTLIQVVTAGTVKIQWAQAVADATDTKLKAGSNLILIRMK